MSSISEIKKNHPYIIFQKLIVVSILIGFLASFLAISLKKITEYYETIFFYKSSNSPWLLIIFPVFSLSVIYFLRIYLFKRKSNKGIKEIFEVTQNKNKNLPLYKIPSHFINGLITVVFGGSTGVEVSTVVATATIGSIAQQKENTFRTYKAELIGAGVAAGITALFGSPIAGIFFVLEVISKKTTKVFFLTNGIAVLISTALLFLLDERPLFPIESMTWNYYAIPYFILLGILAGMNSVYITKCVLFFKSTFAKLNEDYYKVLIGASILSVSLFFLPQLYGDGYHAVKELLHTNVPLSVTLLLTTIAIILLKPIITSITLAAGGDGGVFAPSLFVGAFLGYLLATILNSYFDVQVITLNFMIIGMAAVLSASIHAPFTALFLVCGVTGNYGLFFPLLGVCLIAKYTSKLIYPYTVYSIIPSTVK
ncbi:chloride channel protein [Flavobacterium antarcticum]|uniref:chloride channel protein n=1 Tax=Flavobacterium antarcticum TaxID=271155 RepID=UPI0003B3CF35|nr:chloride channel protein [Flavobacterium antarcticum]